MLISVLMTRKWDFHKMGIDMSRAFVTIKRKRILDVPLQTGCNDAELRLVRALLAWTELWVHLKNELSDIFETSIGPPPASHQFFSPATSLLDANPSEKAPTGTTHQSTA